MISSILPYKVELSTGGTVSGSSIIRYTNTDPYAITLVIRQADGSQESVTWLVSRGIILRGLNAEKWQGDGDFLARRASHNTIAFKLRGPCTVSSDKKDPITQTLLIPRHLLRIFMSRTTNMVPEGSESDHTDWDAFEEERMMW
jgi:hypothetical protein